MASLTRNPRGQLWTPGVPTAPTGPRPRITRALPPGRTWRPAQTRGRQGRRCHEIHRKQARGQRPGKPHPTRPSARTKEERHPAGTTARTTPPMPSWTPAGMTPRRSQHRRCRASTRSCTVSRQAHLQREYTTLGQIATTGEGQATASGAADRTTDERNAPGPSGHQHRE